MAFTNTQVGLERGATQLLLSRAPRLLNRFDSDRGRELRLALENMTEAQATTLAGLIGCNPRAAVVGLTGKSIVTEWEDATDGSGPVTVKIITTGSTTYSCLFGPECKLEPIIGAYPETAPSTSIRNWRAELQLFRLT